MHRHFNVDVLLITQSYGKISQAVRDLVQMVYRVRKNVMLGSTNSYTRKVQDGLRGAVVNTSIRKYQAQYFGLYRSHTQGKALDEFNASDVRPFWKHWTVYGMVACILIGGFIVSRGSLGFSGNPQADLAKKQLAQKRAAVQAKAGAAPAAARPAPVAEVAASAAVTTMVQGDPEPYAGKGLHLVGVMRMGGRELYMIGISQSGVMQVTHPHTAFLDAGYKWKALHDCAGVMDYHGRTRAVTCDAPAMGLNVMRVENTGVAPAAANLSGEGKP